MRTKRMFIDGEYGQIHLRIAQLGSGDSAIRRRPLICLHMSPKSGRIFARLLDVLGTDRVAVAPDYPGYGESDAPPPTPEVTIADYARSIWQVADALSLESIDLLGYHTGSMVAAEMTRQQAERVGGIVLISAPVFLPAELQEFKALYQALPLDEAGTRFSTMWKNVQRHAAPSCTLEMMAESFTENLRGGENYEWGHRAAFAYAPGFPEVVSGLAQRIDVINPDDDVREQTWRIADYLRNGEIHDRPRWGHGFLDFDTEAAATDIRNMLESSY